MQDSLYISIIQQNELFLQFTLYFYLIIYFLLERYLLRFIEYHIFTLIAATINIYAIPNEMTATTSNTGYTSPAFWEIIL